MSNEKDQDKRNLDEEAAKSNEQLTIPPNPQLVFRYSDKVIRWKIVLTLLIGFAIVIIMYLVSPLIVFAFVPFDQHALIMGEVKDVMAIIFTPLCGFLAAGLACYYRANNNLAI